MNGFLTGLRSVFDGFRLIRRPGVKVYVLAPLAINMLLFTCAIVWGAGAVADLMHRLAQQWEWLEWLAWLLWPLFVVVSLTLMFFCFSAIANLLGAPFNGFLAAAVERSLTGSAAASRSAEQGLPGQIRDALRSEFGKFLYLAARAIPLLLLFVIPVVQLAAPFVWFVFGAWLLALEYLEYPLGNRGLPFAQVRALIAGRRGLALGFGTGVLCLTLIPVVNFLAMPIAVAAGTKLVVERFTPAPMATP